MGKMLVPKSALHEASGVSSRDIKALCLGVGELTHCTVFSSTCGRCGATNYIAVCGLSLYSPGRDVSLGTLAKGCGIQQSILLSQIRFLSGYASTPFKHPIHE